MSLQDQINTKQEKALLELINWCGGISNMAKLLDVSPQVASSWKKRGRISATAASEAEKQTQGRFTKKELRPDVSDWRI